MPAPQTDPLAPSVAVYRADLARWLLDQEAGGDALPTPDEPAAAAVRRDVAPADEDRAYICRAVPRRVLPIWHD